MASTPIALNVATVNLKGVGDLTIAMRNDKQTPSGTKIAEAFGRLYTNESALNAAVAGLTATVIVPAPANTDGIISFTNY